VSKGGRKGVEYNNGCSEKFKRSKNVIAKTERVRALTDAGLKKFKQHKSALITILRDAHKLSQQSKRFNPNTSWVRLTKLACTYHWAAGVKQETMYKSDLKARLCILAKAIAKARGLIEQAVQDDVGDELTTAWCEEANEPLALTAEETFKKAVTGLGALEVAARRASRRAHRERVGAGRPKGTSVLPQDYILALRDIYRESTGINPETGPGPFARLVLEFLAAIRQKLSDRHVLELIEDAL